jgi:tRNA-specific adenosine deaminase 1
MDATAISDMIVSATLSQYSSLPFAPQPGKHTVLASFALHDTHSGRVQLLSLGAGVKCLPASRLPVRGDALHDSHAEVIARRGAIRWLLEEVQRDAQAQGQNEHSTPTPAVSASKSAWVCARNDGLYVLRNNVRLWMYASTVPCTYARSFHSHSQLRAFSLLPFSFLGSTHPHPPPSHLPFPLF